MNSGSNLDAMIWSQSVLVGHRHFRWRHARDTARRIVESIAPNRVTSVVMKGVMRGGTDITIV
jgi:hypothetical protein